MPDMYPGDLDRLGEKVLQVFEELMARDVVVAYCTECNTSCKGNVLRQEISSREIGERIAHELEYAGLEVRRSR